MAHPAEHSRRRLPGVSHLPGASFVNDRLSDALILLSALPEIVVALRSIQVHIESVDAEVLRMRQGVNRLEDEVKALGGEIEELGSGMNEVSAAVGRLEPHISDISRIARPLKRRRRAEVERPGEPSALAPAEDEPPLAGLA